MAKTTDPVQLEYEKLIAQRDQCLAEARQHEASGEFGERNHQLDLADRIAPKIHQTELLLTADDRLTEARVALANIASDHASQLREKAELEGRVTALKVHEESLKGKIAEAQCQAGEALSNGEPFMVPDWLPTAQFEVASAGRALVVLRTRIQIIDGEIASFANRLQNARTAVNQATAQASEADAIRALAPIRDRLLRAVIARQRVGYGAPEEWAATFTANELLDERDRQQRELLLIG